MNNIEIENHIGVFHNLMIDILRRRELFKIFESHLIGKATRDEIYNNSFVSFYIMDYVRAQLIDLRKFFETDKSSYKVSNIVKYLEDKSIKDEHESLYKIWKEKYSDQVNKVIAHIDKSHRDITKDINKGQFDEFVDKVNMFLDQVVASLKTKGRLKINNKFRVGNGTALTKQETKSFKQYLSWIAK